MMTIMKMVHQIVLKSINQLAFQTNSEQLVKSEPTDNSQVGGRINKAGYQLKKVNNLLPFFVGI